MLQNHKKILCKNIILNKECKYGNKCLYAHTLDEQNINNNRYIAYNIIKSTSDLSHIDLQTNIELYKTLVQLSVYCNNCIHNKCMGGYNCKYGACKLKYVICLTDLNFNNCTDKLCKKIHLSDRNLKSLKLTVGYDGDIYNSNIYTNITKYDLNNSESDISSNNDNIMNTEEYLLNKSIFMV